MWIGLHNSCGFKFLGTSGSAIPSYVKQDNKDCFSDCNPSCCSSICIASVFPPFLSSCSGYSECLLNALALAGGGQPGDAVSYFLSQILIGQPESV